MFSEATIHPEQTEEGGLQGLYQVRSLHVCIHHTDTDADINTYTVTNHQLKKKITVFNSNNDDRKHLHHNAFSQDRKRSCRIKKQYTYEESTAGKFCLN